jgi:sortase A
MWDVGRLLRIAGELLGTCGVVVLGFLAYMYWGTALRASDAQRTYTSQLTKQWSEATDPLGALAALRTISPGTPLALLRIPQFGRNWQLAIVQGTGVSQLLLAPGHVPGTALPGQVGNFAVAAHRVTAGNPFWSLPSLRKGSWIDVETITATYEYRVTSRPAWVPASDLSVLTTVPSQPGAPAGKPLITLITCDPPWTGTSRVVVTGVLVRTLPRASGS